MTNQKLRLKSGQNHTIYRLQKLVEDGSLWMDLAASENILVKTDQLTDEQHKDIQMAIVDDSLESALSDLIWWHNTIRTMTTESLVQNKP